MKALVKNILLSCTLVALIACKEQGQDNTSTQKSRVDISLGSFTTSKWSPLDLIIPQSMAAIGTLRLCFKRVRFKLSDTDDLGGDDENIDFFIGEVDISDAGTVLGQVEVPAKSYKRIEFDLEDGCGTGNSLELINDNGVYTTSDRITIKFAGNFEATDGSSVVLGTQAIMDQLNNYSGSGSLKDAAETISGNL